jgi:hypothetical protein
VGKPEGKRWEDNIKLDFQEVGCGVVDWIGKCGELLQTW